MIVCPRSRPRERSAEGYGRSWRSAMAPRLSVLGRKTMLAANGGSGLYRNSRGGNEWQRTHSFLDANCRSCLRRCWHLSNSRCSGHRLTATHRTRAVSGKSTILTTKPRSSRLGTLSWRAYPPERGFTRSPSKTSRSPCRAPANRVRTAWTSGPFGAADSWAFSNVTTCPAPVQCRSPATRRPSRRPCSRSRTWRSTDSKN